MMSDSDGYWTTEAEKEEEIDHEEYYVSLCRNCGRNLSIVFDILY